MLTQAEVLFSSVARNLWTVHAKHYVLLWAVSTYQACKLEQFTRLATILIVNAQYSLSSSLLKRFNPLPFSDNTLAWAATLSRSPETPADSYITLLIQYQRLFQDVVDLYREEMKMSDLSQLAMHAKRMAAMLESWWAFVPPHLQATCMDTLVTATETSLIDNRHVCW